MAEVEELHSELHDRLRGLEKRLKYRFQQIDHLYTAICHSSYAFEQARKTARNNEVLEFLGDAVLDLAVGELLFIRFPEVREGELTQMRAALVNESTLAAVGQTLDLGAFLLLGRGEDASGGRQKSSILACAFEAILGAIFVDGGYEEARKFVHQQFLPLMSKGKTAMLQTDSKSRLQEMAQARYGEAPTYQLEKEEGPDHQKQFMVSVQFRGKTLAAASAFNKKEAEQRAAAQAIETFELLSFD